MPSTFLLKSENDSNFGDLVRLPPRWSMPRLANQSFCVRRITTATDVTQQANAVTNPTYQFKLQDLPSYAEFQNLFDQYRFKAVRMTFRPRFNLATITSIATAIFPRLRSVIDYDDNGALPTVSDALQFPSLKETNFDEDHTRIIAPKIFGTAYDGTMISLGPSLKAPWMDTAVPGIAHYGIKTLVEGGVIGQTNLQSWSVELEYFVEFRNVI